MKIKNNVTKIITSLAVVATLSSASAATFENLTAQVGLGSTGTNVSRLQSFLAANSSLYPEALVTGYFGGLTKAAVIRFQAMFGLDQVGRVGPLTLAKINSLINSGTWGGNTNTGADIYAPYMSQVSQNNPSNNATTFTLNTNEAANVRVAYNTVPLTFNEGDMNGNGFTVTGGMSQASVNGLGTSHTVNLYNLTPNTTYYYTIIATDASGNTQLWGVNNTFRTNQ